MELSPSASPEEAAAITAAIAWFDAETAPPAVNRGEMVSSWQRAALVEGVGAKAFMQKHLERGGDQWQS